MLHLLLAPVNWLMRYESYFVCLILFSVLVAIAPEQWQPASTKEWWRSLSLADRAVAALAALAFVWFANSVLHRSEHGIIDPMDASIDRYDEHIPMARLVADDYDHDVVVLQDIGAVAYYSHAKLLGPTGLGSENALIWRRNHTFTAAGMEKWALQEHASIAILQSQGADIRSLTPPQWTLVETVKIPRNIVFADYLVSYYAVQPNQMSRLCASLTQLKLPQGDKIIYRNCSAQSSGTKALEKRSSALSLGWQ